MVTHNSKCDLPLGAVQIQSFVYPSDETKADDDEDAASFSETYYSHHHGTRSEEREQPGFIGTHGLDSHQQAAFATYE